MNLCLCFSFGGTVQYIEESNIYLCFVVCRLKRGLVTWPNLRVIKRRISYPCSSRTLVPLFRGGVPRAQNLGLTPCQRRAENAAASDSSVSSSSSSSCSEALVAEDDLWTGKNAFAAAVLFWAPGRPQRRQMHFFYSEKCIHMILWIASPLCDDTACWHAALRVLRAEAATDTCCTVFYWGLYVFSPQICQTDWLQTILELFR